MTSEGKQALYVIFQNIWKLFVSFEIPGTHLTPGKLLLTVLLFSLSLRIVRTFIASPSSGDINSLK